MDNNNLPNNVHVLLRSLIVYAVCVPLAIFIGFLLANPLDYSSFATFGVLALALAFPLLIRWHYPWLVVTWHMNLMLFFLKGSPTAGLVMVVLSFGISLVERILLPNRQFLRVPQITFPLLCLVAVVLFTAKLTGGFGLRSYGGDVMGGKKYITLLVGILGYFALTSRRIPPEKARLYVALYFLGYLLAAIGDFYPVTPSALQFIFWFIPPGYYADDSFEIGVTRLGNVGMAGFAIICCLWAVYGLRGTLMSGKNWRLIVFFIAFVMMFMGGFRSVLLESGSLFAMLFFWEGLHRTRAMPAFVMIGLMAAVLVVPLASHLPFTFQRTLAFLPLDISTEAKMSAQDSVEWRVNMWKALLPQVPEHLLLGKGYAITAQDYQMMGTDTALHSVDPAQQALALSSDFHNGPLSVVLPFGIWGVIAFLWFMLAGLPVMYRNFRYGDPAIKTINTFLFASYIYACIRFCFLGAALASDIIYFTGGLGLSIALNGGVCRPDPTPVPVQVFRRPRPLPPHPRPAFQR